MRAAHPRLPFRPRSIDARARAPAAADELRADPLELHDLAAKMPAKAAELRAKVEAYETTAFNPDRGQVNPAACDNALGKYGGFWGPFLA